MIFQAARLASSIGMLIDDGTGGLSKKVIGAGIDVHRKFGPGLLENAYHVEIKSVARLEPIHFAQVRTYLSLSGIQVGLLMNFNAPILRHGIHRIFHPDFRKKQA